MTRPKPDALVWLWLSFAVIVADQITKMIVMNELLPFEKRTVIPHLLDWTLAFNTGAAFSLLAGDDGWQRWLFTLLAVVISAALAVWLARTPRRDWRTALPLSLVIGGALGNLIDRVYRGHVIDFILVYWKHWSWPAFNLADSAISVGAVLLIVFGLGARARHPQ